MIEAMACGIPVVAMPNGSVPEVVDDGVTGFIVGNETEPHRRRGDCTCSIGSKYGRCLKIGSPRGE